MTVAGALDDAFGNGQAVSGGGEGSRFAAYLQTYLDAHPAETISIIAHSQGGVLATYTVKQKLAPSYVSRIHAIITADSPPQGINSAATQIMQSNSGCKTGDAQLDSAFDMKPTSAVIKPINDSSVPWCQGPLRSAQRRS